MEQALQDLRITSSILQRKYNDLESGKKQLEKDMAIPAYTFGTHFHLHYSHPILHHLN